MTYSEVISKLFSEERRLNGGGGGSGGGGNVSFEDSTLAVNNRKGNSKKSVIYWEGVWTIWAP